MRPYLTVIIPTYNRRKELATCLEHLKTQSLAQESYEVIVVNDGSTDDTALFLDKEEQKWNRLKVLHQKNAGQGNARNLAIPHAEGQIIMFIGDDIYATENFLKKHVEFHKANPELEAACLGLTEWAKDKKINPFMEWLTEGGPQFAYHKLKAHKEADFWFFYTSNISLKAELLNRQPFDPDFHGYGWEDIELAYRLKKEEGMKITYTPEAFAYHDHYMQEDSLKPRMQKIGSNAHIFQKKHPDLQVVPRGLKKFILWCVGSYPSIIILGMVRVLVPAIGRKLHWYALSKRYFLQGLRGV